MWFYERNSAQHGPVADQALEGLIQSGVITHETRVWKEGMGGWARAQETELLQKLPALPPPPIPASHPSVRRFWDEPAEATRKLNTWFNVYWISLAAGVPLSFVFVGIGGIVTSVVFFYLMLYRFWELIQDGDARTTPGKAVGFCFIPAFQLYWIFVAVWGLAKDLNAYIDDRRIEAPRPSEGLALTYCILICCTVIPFIGIAVGIAALVLWVIVLKQFKDAAVAIIRHRSGAAVALPSLPQGA